MVDKGDTSRRRSSMFFARPSSHSNLAKNVAGIQVSEPSSQMQAHTVHVKELDRLRRHSRIFIPIDPAGDQDYRQTSRRRSSNSSVAHNESPRFSRSKIKDAGDGRRTHRKFPTPKPRSTSKNNRVKIFLDWRESQDLQYEDEKMQNMVYGLTGIGESTLNEAAISPTTLQRCSTGEARDPEDLYESQESFILRTQQRTKAIHQEQRSTVQSTTRKDTTVSFYPINIRPKMGEAATKRAPSEQKKERRKRRYHRDESSSYGRTLGSELQRQRTQRKKDAKKDPEVMGSSHCDDTDGQGDNRPTGNPLSARRWIHSSDDRFHRRSSRLDMSPSEQKMLVLKMTPQAHSLIVQPSVVGIEDEDGEIEYSENLGTGSPVSKQMDRDSRYFSTYDNPTGFVPSEFEDSDRETAGGCPMEKNSYVRTVVHSIKELRPSSRKSSKQNLSLPSIQMSNQLDCTEHELVHCGRRKHHHHRRRKGRSLHHRGSRSQQSRKRLHRIKPSRSDCWSHSHVSRNLKLLQNHPKTPLPAWMPGTEKQDPSSNTALIATTSARTVATATDAFDESPGSSLLNNSCFKHLPQCGRILHLAVHISFLCCLCFAFYLATVNKTSATTIWVHDRAAFRTFEFLMYFIELIISWRSLPLTFENLRFASQWLLQILLPMALCWLYCLIHPKIPSLVVVALLCVPVMALSAVVWKQVNEPEKQRKKLQKTTSSERTQLIWLAQFYALFGLGGLALIRNDFLTLMFTLGFVAISAGMPDPSTASSAAGKSRTRHLTHTIFYGLVLSYLRCLSIDCQVAVLGSNQTTGIRILDTLICFQSPWNYASVDQKTAAFANQTPRYHWEKFTITDLVNSIFGDDDFQSNGTVTSDLPWSSTDVDEIIEFGFADGSSGNATERQYDEGWYRLAIRLLVPLRLQDS